MKKERCVGCDYWRGETARKKKCHRYPKPMRTKPDHWCGEYKERLKDRAK